MENKVEAIFGQFSTGSKDSGDIVATAKSNAAKVAAFLQDSGVINGELNTNEIHQMAHSFGLESFNTSLSGTSGVAALVEEAGIPKHAQQDAIAEIGVILARAAEAGNRGSALYKNHIRMVDATARQGITNYYSMLPNSMEGVYGTKDSLVGSLEYFGADTNKMEADIVTAIVVTLMKFHGAVAPRLLHTISSVNPLVKYIRDEYQVFDLAGDGADAMTPVLELYDDPTTIRNELRKIVPQNAGNAEITYDGFIPKGTPVNLFKVSLESTKYGGETYNRTDLIADDIKLESILVAMAYDDGDGDTVAQELVEIKIPTSVGRLYRHDNSHTTARGGFIKYTTGLTIATHNTLGADSANLLKVLGVASTDKLLVSINAFPSVDIRTGEAVVHGDITVKVVTSAGADVVNARLADATITFIQAKLDARYSEENMRKSSIIATSTPSVLSVEVPPGRFYGADRSHQTTELSEDRARQVSLLQQLASIGQDDAAIKAILGVIDNVKELEAAYATDPINNKRPGELYAAGGKVNPSAIYSTLDLSGIDAFDDSRLADAVATRLKLHMSAVVTDLMQSSKMKQQLGNTQLKFRALCSGEILGKIVGLAPDAGTDASSGVEFTMQLNGNVIVEFVTTTFSYLGAQIVLLPYLESSESVLNFGHNRNCGTIVVGYTASHPATASAERLMASLREAPIPTNVVAAVITVTSIPEATFGYSRS